jgi:hypothetical protein
VEGSLLVLAPLCWRHSKLAPTSAEHPRTTDERG